MGGWNDEDGEDVEEGGDDVKHMLITDTLVKRGLIRPWVLV